VKTIYILLALTFLLLFPGCVPSYKPPRGAGKPTEIIVISDLELYSQVESLLVSNLGREIHTPTTEPIFDLTRVAPDELLKFRYRQNCLILGLIGDALIDSVLAPNARRDLLAGKSHVFSGTDLFVPEQSALIIATPTAHKLAEILTSKRQVIFDYFAQGVRNRIKEVLYKDGYQKDLSSELESDYGFSISIPPNWIVARKELGFVELIHHRPDRIISIYWQNMPRPKIDRSEAIAIRNKIGALYYDHDYIQDDLTDFYWVSFHDLKTAKLDGIWQNDEKVMGGPFRCYLFWSTGRLYAIDLNVFAPGEKKWRWIQQLEIICDTFRTVKPDHAKKGKNAKKVS
jgi:hypothetical protein